jgi:hypothetical protein
MVYMDNEESCKNNNTIKHLRDYELMPAETLLAEYYKDSEDYNEKILQLKDEIKKYKSALAVLSLYVSAGIGDDTLTPKQYVDRIKDGIDYLVGSIKGA